MGKNIFSLEHFCEPLVNDPSYFSKRMFGGLAIYYSDLMVLVLSEKWVIDSGEVKSTILICGMGY